MCGGSFILLFNDFAVFKAEPAVTPTFAIEFIKVVEKSGLLFIAFDNSANVSRYAGAAPTKLSILKLTKAVVANVGSCDEMVLLMIEMDKFNILRLVI